MATSVSLSGNTNLRGEAYLEWYKSSSLALNGVFPSLIHQYDLNRYYDTAVGQSSFPFTAVRAGNATMFDNQGRLVWAEANMFTNGSGAGGTVSTLPTGWQSSTGGIPGATATVVGQRVSDGVIYSQIRYQGTNDATIRYPSAAPVNGASSPSANVGDILTGSFVIALLNDVYGNISTLSPRVEIQDLLAAGTYVNSGSTIFSGSLSSTPTRVSHTRTISGASSARSNVTCSFSIPSSVTFDFTIELGAFQLERTSVNSPQPYISTTGTAKYCARRDYNPATLAARGVLVEGATTNLITTSTAVSTTAGGTSALSPATPKGQSAFRVTFDALGSSGHFSANGSLTLTGSTIYTVSTYYAPVSGGNDLIQLLVTNGASTSLVYANFNTATGTVVGSGADTTYPTIEDCGGGVFRLSLTFTSIAVTSGGSVVILGKINSAADARLPATTGAGEIFDFFGSQCETGTTASSLIPTTGTSATRVADVLTSTPGSWFDPLKGTIYIDFIRRFVAAGTGSSTPFLQLSDGTTSNRIVLLCGSGTNAQQRADVFVAGVPQSQISTTTSATSLTPYKMASKYIVNSFTAVQTIATGGVLATDVTPPGAVPTGINRLDVMNSIGTTQTNGWMKEFRYYPDNSASDAQLIVLTN